MAPPFRLGLIGAGRMGRTHLRALAGSPRVAVTAIAEVSEQVLDRSDIGLCLETGHMMLGGGDPVALLRNWAERVNHVHLKDASLSVRDGIKADQAQATEIWTREAFCALGHGDLDVDAVLDGLRGVSFGGWLVVEQDILPRSAERFARAAQEQRLNRAFLAARGL